MVKLEPGAIVSPALGAEIGSKSFTIPPDVAATRLRATAKLLRSILSVQGTNAGGFRFAGVEVMSYIYRIENGING